MSVPAISTPLTARRRLANAALRAAIDHPTLARCALWAWAQPYLLFQTEPQWLFYQAADALNYRVHATARLKNGMPIRVVWNDLVGLEIWKTGCYEPTIVDTMSKLLAPGMVVLDIGAHVGQYTLVASQLVGTAGEVHSFEPDPRTFRCLSHNVKRNRLRNVRLNHQALFSADGFKTFYLYPPRVMGGNRLSPPVGHDPFPTCEVSCTTLDGYSLSKGLKHIDVIKIDAEGAEVDILTGATKILSGDDKPTILLEFNGPGLNAFGHSTAELSALLNSHGYDLFEITDHGLKAQENGAHANEVYNCLALPKSRKAPG